MQTSDGVTRLPMPSINPVRPAHYAVGAEHEVYKCLRAWGLESDAFLWTVVKYISRCGKKAGNPILQDLRKAAWYLNQRIEQLEAENAATIKGALQTLETINPKHKGTLCVKS